MERLPDFNKEQKNFVIKCLQTETPYKTNRLPLFLLINPDYAAEMPEELFVEKFPAKCRCYVADKRSSECEIIKHGKTPIDCSMMPNCLK